MFKKPLWSKISVYLPFFAAVFLFSFFFLLPAFLNLVFSVTDFDGNINQIHYIGLQNFVRAFTLDQMRISNSLFVTLVFTIGSVIPLNTLGLALAVLALDDTLYNRVIRVIVFSPAILGTIVVGLTWRLMLDPTRGPVNAFLQKIGEGSALLGDLTLSLPLVIFVRVWMYLGYTMLIYTIGLKAINSSIYDAAVVDGASSFQVFRLISLPLLIPAILVNLFFTTVGALNTYDIIVVLTNGGPLDRTTTLPLFVYRILTSGSTIASRYGTLAYGTAISTVHFILVMLAALVAYIILRKAASSF